jgi:hypothetical protein
MDSMSELMDQARHQMSDEKHHNTAAAAVLSQDDKVGLTSREMSCWFAAIRGREVSNNHGPAGRRMLQAAVVAGVSLEAGGREDVVCPHLVPFWFVLGLLFVLVISPCIPCPLLVLFVDGI